MAQGGVEESVLLEFIHTSPVAYSLSSADIIRLREMKISSNVITALIRHGNEVREREHAAQTQNHQKAAPAPASTATATTTPAATATATSTTTAAQQPPQPTYVANAPLAAPASSYPTVVYAGYPYPYYYYPSYSLSFGWYGGYPGYCYPHGYYGYYGGCAPGISVGFAFGSHSHGGGIHTTGGGHHH